MARLAAKDAPAGSRWSFKRFRRDEDGATAVEFGLIALPFIALMMATIEIALVFFAGQALETAVDTASRLIRTGQAQQDGFNADDFKKEAVRLTETSGRTVAQVADDLGVGLSSLTRCGRLDGKRGSDLTFFAQA